MKRIITYTLVLFLLLFSNVMAFEPSISSGEKTADAVIHNGNVYITALAVMTDGTNDARVILYNSGSSAIGKIIWEVTVAGGDNYGGRIWAFPTNCNDGIYADVNGTGASYIVEYIVR